MPVESKTRPAPSRKRRRRWGRRLLLLYLIALAASHLVRWVNRIEPAPLPDQSMLQLDAVDGDRRLAGTPVRLNYRDLRSAGDDDAPAIVLLHGSPGQLQDFAALGDLLAAECRVIIPDLPGFGRSQPNIPDYSVRAHAHYVLQMLDLLQLEQAHVLAFSMGGGVALEMIDLAPERVASLSMVGAIGVQELELLGNYTLNHIIHGIQLAGLWFVHEGVPHFGALDHGMLSIEYGRNFYDTDQRSLRGILQRVELPVLIIHGREDPLVPFAAATEHHRLMPHSELALYEHRSHFLLWTETESVAATFLDFLGRVQSGTAAHRAQATPERLADAARSFDEFGTIPAPGMSLAILLLLIVAGTFLTEDLTCIATGLLIVDGRLPWQAGFLACFCGIYFGDQLLYFAGRWLGRPAMRRAPWKWFVREEGLRQAAAWFEKRGLMVIFLSRFIPGSRLPTYVTVGVVRANYVLFALYFLAAVIVWTPLLLGLTILVGREAEAIWTEFTHLAFFVVLGTVSIVLLVLRVLIPATTHRGRRLLYARWQRTLHWEFWPPWAFYPPVVLRVLWLSIKHGGFAKVTAVNPAIPTGGFVGESKFDILQSLSGSREFLARTARLGDPGVDRAERARAFMAQHGLGYPVVFKPDAGQRGAGVVIAHDEDQLRAALANSPVEMLVQEYVAGLEYGLFYARRPDEAQGRILSITEKVLPELSGDGHSTLEELILDDDRAVCMAKVYFATLGDDLARVPARDERVRLAELGTHCRGAIFRDGNALNTAALEARLDAISQGFEGFFFGRYDVRVPSVEALQRGRDFKILELNGLTSEATHIYDARMPLRDAYRVLFEQWELAFEIARENIRRGARPSSLVELVRVTAAFYSAERAG